MAGREQRERQAVRHRGDDLGLWDVNPVNLFRITWKNDVKTGLFGGVNWNGIWKMESK